MDEILIAILAGGGTGLIVCTYVFVNLVTNPDKIELWASILNKILADIGFMAKRTRRNYVRFDLQSRINLFTKEVESQAPYFEDSKVKVEFVDTSIDRKSFLRNGNVVLRLRHEDPEDLNFVHGAYWTVSAKLLPRVKRYISPTQKKAIDVFVTGKIIEKKDFHIMEHFLDHYLSPLVDKNDDVKQLFDQFYLIDQYGAFYPVFLQELYFLSMKIYGGPQREGIVKEVVQLANFLYRFAVRNVGEEIESNFSGEFCKFGIVIVGTGEKMSLKGPKPYIDHVQKVLLKKKVETIYVLGKYEYYDFMNDVADALYMNYDILKTHDYDATLNFEGGGTMSEHTYLIVLRYLDADMYQGGSIHEAR